MLYSHKGPLHRDFFGHYSALEEQSQDQMLLVYRYKLVVSEFIGWTWADTDKVQLESRNHMAVISVMMKSTWMSNSQQEINHQ